MESRLTFRRTLEEGEKSWQRQLRDSYAGVSPVENLSLKQARIRPVNRELAKRVILQYEWLGTMGSTSKHYGIFFEDYCAGVTCFQIGAAGAGVYVARSFGIGLRELGYLARGACVTWAPSGTNSKLVAHSTRLFGETTGVSLVIAYADTDAGEIGTIYQACDWTYIGKGSSTSMFVSPKGRLYDHKLPANLKRTRGGSRAYWRQKLLDSGWREQKSNPKHRYVCVTRKKNYALLERIEKMRKPYPKRPKQATVGDQPTSGGAAPTRTLQTLNEDIAGY